MIQIYFYMLNKITLWGQSYELIRQYAVIKVGNFKGPQGLQRGK